MIDIDSESAEPNCTGFFFPILTFRLPVGDGQHPGDEAAGVPADFGLQPLDAHPEEEVVRGGTHFNLHFKWRCITNLEMSFVAAK